MGTLGFGSSWHLAGLRWERSWCCSAADTVAPGGRGAILSVGVSFSRPQQSWHRGGPAALRPALLIREKSPSVPVDPCQAKQPRVWATQSSLGATDASFGVWQLMHCECFDAQRWKKKKKAVSVQLCPKEVIESKLLLKAKGRS